MAEEAVRPLLVMGTRPYTSEFLDVVEGDPRWRAVGFIENLDRDRCDERIEGLPIHWIDDIDRFADDHWAVCSLATTKREAFVEQVAAKGLDFATIVHRTAYVSPRSTIGEGCRLGIHTIVAACTTIGPHVSINRAATVGHHTTIGDTCTIQPQANVAGFCHIGRRT